MNPIYNEKKNCYLCKFTNKLTYHHIIPRREIIFNGYENILVLCRKCHNIIDMNVKTRTEKCYDKNKKVIDKYNRYLKKNLFPEDLLWEIYSENIKEKQKNGKVAKT